VRKTSASLSAKLADERRAAQQVAGDLDQLKQASSDANSKLTEISADVSSVKGDVSSVKGDVASTQTQVEQHGSDLKRVTGDMGVMSGLIATNANELKELRALGERDYIEFHLKRGGGMQKVGKVQLALDKADPKRNRFTFDVLADDKRVQKRDRTINEPIQLYLAGSRQPCEIVVNEVKKDEVVGYLAVPKLLVAAR
jgi:chromosome segregation ATPase